MSPNNNPSVAGECGLLSPTTSLQISALTDFLLELHYCVFGTFHFLFMNTVGRVSHLTPCAKKLLVGVSRFDRRGESQNFKLK